MNYSDSIKLVLHQGGLPALMGRGLTTRIFTNAIQSSFFTVIWKLLERQSSIKQYSSEWRWLPAVCSVTKDKKEPCSSEISNIQIVKNICSILDSEIPLKSGRSFNEKIIFVDDRPGHDFRYAIDASKVTNLLNWKPDETFASGIKKTVEWYLKNKVWCDRVKDGSYKDQRIGITK